MPKKFFEKVTEHIWEIKVHHGKEQFRLFSFIEDNAIIIAVHGFAKKAMDLKQQDIDTAEERRKTHIRRKSQFKKLFILSDIEKFIAERKARNPRAWAKFADKYRRFAIGMLLADHREKSGMTLSQLARKIGMQKTALSRLENHGEDVRLSTITRYVEATGRPLYLRISPLVGRRVARSKMAAAVELEDV